MPKIQGCTNPRAPNYDAAAEEDIGTCGGFCGDRSVNQIQEQCDDGNDIGGDGCNSCNNECPLLSEGQTNTNAGRLGSSFLSPLSATSSTGDQNGFVGRLQRWISSLFSPLLKSSVIMDMNGNPVVYGECGVP